MQSLLDNTTKFISTVLELYYPLPFELATDLHTLNAYLRTYKQSEELLLTGFVNRVSEKLSNKLKEKIKIDKLTQNYPSDDLERSQTRKQESLFKINL